MRKATKKRARRPLKLSPELREYLAYIGRLGGQKSRRWLSRTHAKEMVAIREAKRAAVKEGRLEWARKRIPLSKLKFSPIYRRPSVRPRRLMGTLGADSM
jgi:hypothetical protein